MKNIILFFITASIIIGIPIQIYSQESTASKWSMGIAAGPQFTNISSPGLPSPPESGVGFMAGIFTERNISQSFKIRLGLNFDQRAFSSSFQSAWFQFNDSVVSQNSYSAYDFNYKLDYITIPISIIYIKGVDNFKLFIQASAYYSLFLQAHRQGYADMYIAEGDFQYIDHEKYPDIQAGHNRTDYHGTTDKLLESEKFNTSDFGANFFIGVIYDFSEKVGIYLSPGFTASFGSLLENPAYDSKWDRIFKIEAGVVFHLN